MFSVLNAATPTPGLTSGIKVYPTGRSPWGVAFDSSNVWVTNQGDSSVTVRRKFDGALVMTVTTGNTPQGIAFDGTNMWITNLNGDNVSVIRASDGFHVMTPSVTAGYPFGIAFDGEKMWVAGSRMPGMVNSLRITDGQAIDSIPVGGVVTEVGFDGTNIWAVNNDQNYVSVIRASDGARVMTPTVGTHPWGIAYDGSNMWIINAADPAARTASMIRASDGFHVMTPTIPNSNAPLFVAFDGQNMWITESDPSIAHISVLSTTNGSLVMTQTAKGRSWGIGYDGASIWVTSLVSNTVSKIPVIDVPVYDIYVPIVVR